MENTTFTIDGMHCKSCKMLIEDALGDVSGVHSATVDLESGRASISYDGTATDEASLRKAIENEGYGVR